VDADLMLRWMSETGAGSVRDLRERVIWLARTADLHIDGASAGRWLRDLSALAYTEVDWRNDRWAMGPPVVTRLPMSDGTAVLTGSRRAGLVEQIEASEVSVLHHQPASAAGDLPAPTSIFIQYDDVNGLREAAASVGATYAGCAALKLAERLPDVRLGPPAPPPASSNATVERLAEGDGIVFTPSGTDEDGLYRLKLQGRLAHLYQLDGQWHHCGLAVGVFTDHARRGRSVIRWRGERQTDNGDVGTLFVDWGSPLPPLHARTLTLCSGLPPRLSAAARTAIYGNVPAAVATAVARSLSQWLQPA